MAPTEWMLRQLARLVAYLTSAIISFAIFALVATVRLAYRAIKTAAAPPKPVASATPARIIATPKAEKAMPSPKLISVIRNPDGEFYRYLAGEIDKSHFSEEWNELIRERIALQMEQERREREEAEEALRAAASYLDKPLVDTSTPTKTIELLPMLPMPTLLDGLTEGEIYCFIGGAFVPRSEYLTKMRTA